LILNACSRPFRSCILLATVLFLMTASIVPVCIAAGESGDLEIPAADPAFSPASCGTDGGSSGTGTDTAGYCTRPGANIVKVNPSGTVPVKIVTPNPKGEEKGVVVPTTTTAAVAIRINNTPAVVHVNTTTPVTLSPLQTIVPKSSIAVVTTTFCRDCTKAPLSSGTKNQSAVKLAPTLSAIRRQSPPTGLLESVVGLIGSVLGLKPAGSSDQMVGNWQLVQAKLVGISLATSPSVTYKDPESRFIEIETSKDWDIYGTDLKGTYTWNPGTVSPNNLSSAVWQVSLYPFPYDKKAWSNPSGLLGYGYCDLQTHEFTVDYGAFIPPVADVNGHWKNKTSLLQFQKSELDQIQIQLAAQKPFDPSVGQLSPADIVMNERLNAARVDIEQKMSNPSFQGYHAIYQSGNMMLRSLPPPDHAQTEPVINPIELNTKMTGLKEALVLTLPIDQRMVYVRVVTRDAAGNATGLSNSLPVGVGKKQINLISPWSDWQILSPATGQSDAVSGWTISGVYFNKKIYLFASGSADNKVRMATLDANNVFSGWSELPGSPTTVRGLSVAAVSFRETDDPTYIYLAMLPNDGSSKIRYNRMDRQGSWAGWKDVPGSILTEDPPVLTSWVRNLDKGLVLTAREKDSHKNRFTYITWDKEHTMSDEVWQPWQEIPDGPLASVPPAGTVFSYDRPETPIVHPDFNKGFVFVGRSVANSTTFRAQHIYTIMCQSGYENGQTVWHWTNWSEIPGDEVTTSTPSVIGWNDRIYVAIKNKYGKMAIADFDALGEWNNWTALPNRFPEAGTPVITGGDTLRLVGSGAGGVGDDKLIVATLTSARFLVSSGATAPPNWIYCPDGDIGSTMDCTNFYSIGGISISSPSLITGSWAATQQDGKRVIWQASRIPFNDTLYGNETVTFNDIMYRTPGVAASGVRAIDPEMQLSDKPSFIPPLHPFSMNPDQFAPNPSERLTFYARAIILSTTDTPGELNGYVTQTTKFIYGPPPAIKTCPMPQQYVVNVPVPDVKIIEYQPYYPGFEPGCHYKSTKAWSKEVAGMEMSPCPTVNSLLDTCKEPSWWDKVSGFFSSIIDFFASVINFVSRAWDTIKSTCINAVASAIPLCDDTCKSAVSGCVDAGLASVGIPPQIPNFADLEDMGADYLVAKMVEETGVPKDVARQGIDALHSSSQSSYTSGDSCGWIPDPDTQPKPAYIKVRLKNDHIENSTPGNLYVKTPVGGSSGYNKMNLFSTNTPNIPYPSMQPGEELIIPIFLTPSIGALDGSDGGVPGDIWQNAASDPNLRLEVRADPRTSIDIAGLEETLGMKYVYMTSYHPIFAYGQCPQKEFYVTYVYGKNWDLIGFNPNQAFSR
jgi:hypothetical protein